MHHDIDYTLFEGIEVGNWSRYTLLRGQVFWDQAKGITGQVGFGQYLKRGKGQLLVRKTGNVPRGMKSEGRGYWVA